jgi:DNA-binding transcriptional MerR regulator
MEQEVFGAGRVAREVGISRAQLLALIDRGRLPDVAMRVEGRRLFSPADVERIRAALARHPEWRGAKGEGP